MREALHAYKFRGRRALSGPLGDLLVEAMEGRLPGGVPALLVPVPLHPRRERERGFNQASLLAWRVGRADTGTPYVTPFPSPDGEPIALTRSVDRVNQLCVMRADGSQLLQSTFGDVPSMFPAWSPRGDRLVHVRGDPSAKAPTGRLAVLTLARG